MKREIIKAINNRFSVKVDLSKIGGVIRFHADVEPLKTKLLNSECIYAPHYNSLSIEEWLKEFEDAIKS